MAEEKMGAKEGTDNRKDLKEAYHKVYETYTSVGLWPVHHQDSATLAEKGAMVIAKEGTLTALHAIEGILFRSEQNG